MRKLWGGAFGEESHRLVDEFGRSFESDLTFWQEDVEGSLAHAQMLLEQGIISQADGQRILAGLKQILEEGPESLPNDVEDIHTSVEARLADLIGEAAGRLHTARSRNDQVATDAHLWLRKEVGLIQEGIRSLQECLLTLAEAHSATVMPGVTHQQHAQPITLGFHLMAHFWLHQRHGWRLDRLKEVISFSPLGSAALSGSSFPIDRQRTAELLGFQGPSMNALLATSDRSFILDALHICAMMMLDLSRMSQELVLWSSPEFGFVRLSDGVTTGSSIMPQKRNPDMAELIRGRTGRAIGNWTALAATMKGMVLGYNRDTQEDKPPLFESCRLVRQSLELCRLMLEGATFNAERMEQAASRDFSTATDLADFLAKGGMPFRQAHEVTGRVVRWCQEKGLALEDLTPELLEEAAPGTSPEALPLLKARRSAEGRDSFGGTAPEQVMIQVAFAREAMIEPVFRLMT